MDVSPGSLSLHSGQSCQVAKFIYAGFSEPESENLFLPYLNDFNILKQGSYALLWGALDSSFSLVARLLLRHSADVNTIGNKSRTPIFAIFFRN
jgi:hypothetical protein